MQPTILQPLWRSVLLVSIMALVACASEGPAPDITVEANEEPAVLRPASLTGTEPDGALRTDAEGHFVLDAQALRWFDYHLTAEGELSDDELRAWTVSMIAKTLREPAAAEAAHQFDQYRAYRSQASALLNNSSAADQLEHNPEALVDQLEAILDRTLAKATPALAQRESRAIDRALALRAVLADTDLDVDKRRQLLAQIETTMVDPAERQLREEAMREARRPLELRRHVERLRSEGADAATIHQQRIAQVGSAAAERLAQLDLQRQQWQQRLGRYQDERRNLLTRHLQPEAQAQALRQLRLTHFDDHEMRRVLALEAIEANQP